jgi:hypothetical protein
MDTRGQAKAAVGTGSPGLLALLLAVSSVAKSLAGASFPTIALSPPLIGMASLAIGVGAVLGMRRGVSGHRLAIAALVIGGATYFYWLFNLIWGLNAE